MKNAFTFIMVLLIFMGQSCKQKGYETQISPDFLNGGLISNEGTRFIDSYGRQVILSGINKVNKDPLKNYTDNDSARTYTNFRQWGFNCVRLGVFWAGVEPEPGKYDEKYLDKLEEQVKWAGENGVYVLLDMHQDLYGYSSPEGELMGDGAPKWATITENQPHVKGAIWSDSYLISPAVQKAFDNFWVNKPASDGIGIQDHYAKMWNHIAERFSGNKAVIGFDIMNEPFNGTSGLYILPLILQEFARLYAEETGKILSENEARIMWSDEEHKFEAISRLKDAVKYARVFDAGRELNQKFEKSVLQPMYQKVAESIREADTTHILFMEHGYFGNAGILSAIEPVKERNGQEDPRVSYAAHAYDLLVDTKNYESQSNSRLELLFSRINETSERMHCPVIIGEWGAFSGNSEAISNSARFITGLFDRFGFSNTYWCYYPNMEKDLYFKNAIVRPYPRFTGGKLKDYNYNYETGIFICSWKESPTIKAPTVIFIPDLTSLQKENIKLNPESKNILIKPVNSSKAGYLIIPVSGDTLTRKVEFKLDKTPATK